LLAACWLLVGCLLAACSEVLVWEILNCDRTHFVLPARGPRASFAAPRQTDSERKRKRARFRILSVPLVVLDFKLQLAPRMKKKPKKGSKSKNDVQFY
jgi:hypothetical protein